jgi:hypothetical protein
MALYSGVKQKTNSGFAAGSPIATEARNYATASPSVSDGRREEAYDDRAKPE